MLSGLTPEEVGFLSLLIPMLVLYASVMGTVTAYSLMSDLIDDTRCRYQSECTSFYFAIFNFTQKTFVGLGNAFGLLVVSRFGFRPDSPVYSEGIKFAMSLVVGYFLFLFNHCFNNYLLCSCWQNQ